MERQPQIHFHQLPRSDALERAVHKRIAKLEQFYDRILGCDVTIEAPHHHQHKGHRYRVVIKLSVPGTSLVVSHDDDRDSGHDDCYLAIHDAFDAARRQLQDFVRIRRDQVKRHRDQRQGMPAPPQAERDDEETETGPEPPAAQ